jgi:kynurenine formamidase
MTWIDLSQRIFSDMPSFPGDGPVAVTRLQEHGPDPMQLSRIAMSVHTGTHLDAPRHFLAAGLAVDEIKPERLIGPAYVAAFPDQPGLPGRRDPAAALPQLSRLDLSRLRPGDALLLATGWDALAGNSGYYVSVPGFAPGSADFLVRRGIRLFGLDLPTVWERRSPDESFDDGAMHRALLQAGILIVESLVGLQALAGRRVEFMALPLPLADGDGSPVRAMARLLDD